MANALLRGQIREVHVLFNGDRKDGKLRAKLAKLDGEVAHLRKDVAKAKKDLTATEKRKPRSKKLIDKARESLADAEKELAEAEKERKDEEPEKDNTIVASFAYPRSGASTVLAQRPVDLPSGKPKESPFLDSRGQLRDFLDTGLFKEEVQGETILQIHVTDRDKEGSLVTFFRKVFAAIFKVATKGVLGDISEVVVNGSATAAVGALEGAIKGSGKG